MQITIPIKSYLKKYLTKKYGSELILSRKSSLGIHLLELLEGDFNPKELVPATGDDIYLLNIGEFYSNTKGVTIHTSRINNISAYLDKVFLESLFEHVKIYKANYNQELPAIRQFLEFYDITDNDLRYDSVYRTYKRYKQKGQILHS